MENKIDSLHPWSRAIILIDMNAFFAAIEQLDHPEWQGRALGITNGKQGTCIITSSYEARSYGIKTGMRVKEAKYLCNHFIQVPARPERYVEVSRCIMSALNQLTPDIEVFSVDEAFLDVTHCQLLWGSPEKIGLLAKELVYQASGLLCSVGVSGDKTTAKYAAKLIKPDGFFVIPPWESKERLKNIAVTELSGIKKGIGNFLKKYGATYCGDVEKIPVNILTKRFGNALGRRIWLMCQGADPEPVHTIVADPKSMGHGKVMPPNTTDKNIVNTFLLHMCEKLGERLRRHHFRAQYFFAGLLSDFGWIGARGKSIHRTNNTKEIYALTGLLISQHWNEEPIHQIQVTALDPSHEYEQFDLFDEINKKEELIYKTMDEINNRFGEFTISPAPILSRSQMPNVIAPAWKPYGHRQTI